MGFRKADDFYIALGQGKISPKTVANKVFQRLKQGEAVAGDETEARLAGVLEGRDERQRRTQEASDYGIKVEGRRRRDGAARQVLPSGARRRDRRLRLARARDHDPPRGLPQHDRADEARRSASPTSRGRATTRPPTGSSSRSTPGTAPACSRTSRGPSPRPGSTSSRPSARPSTRWSRTGSWSRSATREQLQPVRRAPAKRRLGLRRLPGDAHWLSRGHRQAIATGAGRAAGGQRGGAVPRRARRREAAARGPRGLRAGGRRRADRRRQHAAARRRRSARGRIGARRPGGPRALLLPRPQRRRRGWRATIGCCSWTPTASRRPTSSSAYFAEPIADDCGAVGGRDRRGPGAGVAPGAIRARRGDFLDQADGLLGARRPGGGDREPARPARGVRGARRLRRGHPLRRRRRPLAAPASPTDGRSSIGRAPSSPTTTARPWSRCWA